MGDPLHYLAPAVLRHEGIAYSGPSALVPTASALLTEWLQEGAVCMVLADGDTLRSVRETVDLDTEDTTFFDMSVHGRNPARVLPALQSFVEYHGNRPLRVVAEPVRVGISDSARAEAELNELILDLSAYRAWPATMICLYDRTSLQPEVSESLDAQHRAEVTTAEARARVVERFAEALPPAPDTARRAGADITTLPELRRTITAFAAAAELASERVDDFVYAVNEVVTNSICHGEGRARVLMWRDAVGVWCDVHDRGRIGDPLVGRIAPRPGQASGRGLWLVNQMCDLAQVRSSAAGTSVRMSIEF